MLICRRMGVGYMCFGSLCGIRRWGCGVALRGRKGGGRWVDWKSDELEAGECGNVVPGF